MNRRAFLGATSAFGLAALSRAQQSTPPSKLSQQQPARPDELSVITVDVTRVNLLFTVTDRKGRFITDLTKEDFEVIESKKPQVIQEFTAESDLPLRLGVLIDTSNSIRERFKFEQDAAIEFLNNTIHANQDRAMLVSFDTKAELVSDLVSDTEKLATAIRSLRPGGGTSLYDAIFFAC